MGAYYFLTCLLPPLPSTLGEKLPLPFSELSRMIRRHIHARGRCPPQGHLSVIDAANFENREQGRDLFLEGGILSREDMEARRNLAGVHHATFLEEKERGIRRPHLHDRLWELCYGALLAWPKKTGCRYLIDYIPWEIELRNRLTALRLRDSAGECRRTCRPARDPELRFHGPALRRSRGRRIPLPRNAISTASV